jgi:hypothetical protein
MLIKIRGMISERVFKSQFYSWRTKQKINLARLYFGFKPVCVCVCELTRVRVRACARARTSLLRNLGSALWH